MSIQELFFFIFNIFPGYSLYFPFSTSIARFVSENFYINCLCFLHQYLCFLVLCQYIRSLSVSSSRLKTEEHTFWLKNVVCVEFPGLSRTCIKIPGLSRPGKTYFEIQGLPRFSRTCAHPVSIKTWNCFSFSIQKLLYSFSLQYSIFFSSALPHGVGDHGPPSLPV